MPVGEPGVSVPAETDASVMPASSQLSVVLGAVHGNRGVLLRSTCVRIPDSPWPSRNGVARLSAEGGSKAVDVLHERCAGLDISKKDANGVVTLLGV